MWLLQLAMIINLALITYQDIKQREVLWFLFPVAALLMGVSYYVHTEPLLFAMNSAMNLSLIVVILMILFLYAKFKLKKSFLQETFGLGDLLFFVAFALGFPFVTFVVVFVFSLLFSLILTLVIQSKEAKPTVPLAGYMAIFLMVVFCVSWMLRKPNLYQL